MSMHKCENCETEVNWNGRKQRGKRCVGWIGSGVSKWRKKYDKQGGVAWWCPMCQEEKDLETVK